MFQSTLPHGERPPNRARPSGQEEMTMKRTLPQWKQKLTAAERHHLDETGAPTLDAFRRNRKGQAGNEIICLECAHIARKLGIEEPTQ